MKLVKTAVVVLLSLAFSASAFSQEKKLLLSIEDAVKIAMEHNVSVIEALNSYNSALASTKTKTWGNNLPTLSANTNYRRSSEPVTTFVNEATKTSQNSYSYSLDANYVVFNGFKNWEEKKQFKAIETESNLTYERTKQTVKLDVYRQYFDVLKKQQLLKVRKENLKRSSEDLKKVEEMHKIGSVPLSDVYKQKVLVGNDKLGLINGENDLNIARATLNSLIGIEVNTEIVLDEVDLTMVDQDLQYEQLMYVAIDNRKDLKAAAQAVNSSKSGLTISKSGFYPTLSVFSSYSWSDLFSPNSTEDITDNDRLDLGLNLSIPIFNGFETQAATVIAEQNLITSKSRYESTQRTVSLEVKTTILNVNAAKENIKVTQETLKSATEDLRLATERYNIGAGTILDVITANASFVEAESNNIQAAYDYLLAREELKLATGEIE